MGPHMSVAVVLTVSAGTHTTVVESIESCHLVVIHRCNLCHETFGFLRGYGGSVGRNGIRSLTEARVSWSHKSIALRAHPS
jgi:hypothetical protein